MFAKMMVIYLVVLYGMLLQLSEANIIVSKIFEIIKELHEPENYDNVNCLIDEYLGFFTDDMEFCEGKPESDAVCYDKSGLKVKMVESIDKVHKDYAPNSVQYAYIIENEYGDEITTKFELMLSSKKCIITLKESHRFEFGRNDKIKKLYAFGMEEEEDCTPTTSKHKGYVFGTTEDKLRSYDGDICSLPKVTGDCESYYIRWYYDGKECEEFTYGGCDGNENNFESLAECELHCDEKATTKKTWTTSSPTYKATNKPTDKPTNKPTDWPTKAPTKKPTKKPTDKPTEKPTYAPTKKPTTPKPTTAKPTTGKPTMWEKKTNEPTTWKKTTNAPTVWKKETPEPTVWSKETNKPSLAPTKKDEYY